MKNKHLLIFFILLSFACHRKTVEVTPSTVDYDYYPLDSGRFWVYQVHHVNYNITVTDTTYFVKELIYNIYESAPGVVKHEVYRFYKPELTDDWPVQPDSVWTVYKTTDQLSRVEFAREYIRLVFPADNNRSWNGNALNTSFEDLYKIKNKGLSRTVGSFNFTSTLQVEEENNSNLIGKDVRYTYYAKGVGPVEIHKEILSYKIPITSPPQIDLGDIIDYTLIDYGTP
ncbi:MAG: hypothetical protein U0U66_05585 [Cytophagaceae bacterium]